MYRDTVWVEPSTVHHFRELNEGRSDPQSWGDPARELPLSFREPHEEKGKGKPLAWDISKGLVVAHLFADTPRDRCTIEQACAERVERLASLWVLDPQAALVYEALYFKDGKPIIVHLLKV